VIAQGHDPNGTEVSLRESQQMAVEAGYNVRCKSELDELLRYPQQSSRAD